MIELQYTIVQMETGCIGGDPAKGILASVTLAPVDPPEISADDLTRTPGNIVPRSFVVPGVSIERAGQYHVGDVITLKVELPQREDDEEEEQDA